MGVEWGGPTDQGRNKPVGSKNSMILRPSFDPEADRPLVQPVPKSDCTWSL